MSKKERLIRFYSFFLFVSKLLINFYMLSYNNILYSLFSVFNISLRKDFKKMPIFVTLTEYTADKFI